MTLNLPIKLTNLSVEKIKIILYSIGLNEKYIAFEHLASLINLLLFQEDSKKVYNQAIATISNQYQLESRTLTQGLARILKMCKATEITQKMQFNVSTNRLFNKIQVIKHHVENVLNKS